MGDKEYSGSEFRCPEELQFQEKSTASNNERVGSRQDQRTGRIYDETETFVQ